MSDEKTPAELSQSNVAVEQKPAEANANVVAAAQGLDSIAELDQLDFLLEEIENKIAPLALA